MCKEPCAPSKNRSRAAYVVDTENVSHHILHRSLLKDRILFIDMMRGHIHAPDMRLAPNVLWKRVIPMT